jgi:uncharacterized protein (TIGR02246 family)
MPNAETEKQVTRLYNDVLGAWNRRDAAGMARCYAPHGSQVGFDGSTANGAAEIETHLAPIFAHHKTPAFVAKVREVRMIGNDAALLRAVAGMVPDGKDDINPDVNAIQTMVASRDEKGQWRVEMFHNTPAAFHGRPEEKEELSQELRDVLRGKHH